MNKKLKSLLQVIDSLSTDKPDEKVLESLNQMLELPAFQSITTQIKAKIEELTPAIHARKKHETLKSVVVQLNPPAQHIDLKFEVEPFHSDMPTQTMQPCDSLDCEHVPPEMRSPDYSKPWPEIEAHIKAEWKRFTDFYDDSLEFPVQFPE